VGVNQAKPAKPAGSSAQPADLRQFEPGGVSQNDVTNETVARQEDADLASKFIGNCGQVFCQFRRYDLFRCDTSPEYTLERAALRLLDAEGVSVDLVDGDVSFFCWCNAELYQ
jgi:hypothetical protein